jgi:hypothetical protein
VPDINEEEEEVALGGGNRRDRAARKGMMNDSNDYDLGGPNGGSDDEGFGDFAF